MALDYEKLAAAARKAFATKQVKIGEGVSVTVRELSRPKRDELNAHIYVIGPDGKPLTHDKDGKPDPAGATWLYKPGVNVTEEWIVATMDPEVTVEQLMSEDWPDSLKGRIFDAALEVNGLGVKDAVKN